MEIETNQNISLLDQAKIQAQVLVPLLRALRRELGEARANEIAYRALRDWSRELFLAIGAQLPGGPREKWQTMYTAVLPRIGTDLDFKMLVQNEEQFEFDVTGCRYAEFFRQLGELELGTILMCERDLHMEEVGSPAVEMTRT